MTKFRRSAHNVMFARLIELIKECEVNMLTPHQKASEIWKEVVEPLVEDAKVGKEMLEFTKRSNPQ